MWGRIHDTAMYRSTAYVQIMGHTRGRGSPRQFGICHPDRLFHTYIIGQTGTGKSTLLWNLMRQDAEHGQGFCLIDPHGDLAESVVKLDAPAQLYWNVADSACPYGYNPLAFIAQQHRPLVASGLISTLRKQWVDAWGARMEHLLRFALLALLDRPDSNIADIMPLFLNDEFRRQVVRDIADEQVREFWTKEYPALRYKTSSDGVAPIANKLGAFLAHPVIRKAVCDPEEPLRFRKIMDEGGTLIVNLAKGKLGADVSNLLGGLIVSSIANAAYSRQDQPAVDRRPFFLYIDEFHSFTTAAFADMLPELRKYGLGLVVATQSSTRLDDSIREAIFGNVGTLISFRVGANDAAILTKHFSADVPSNRDLVGLANCNMFVRLMIDGMPSKPFSATSLPPGPAGCSRSSGPR